MVDRSSAKYVAVYRKKKVHEQEEKLSRMKKENK